MDDAAKTFLGLPWIDDKPRLLKSECVACGHTHVQQRIPLQYCMVRFLGPLLRADGPVHKRDLRGKLNNVTYVQGHYLRHWGLIETKDPMGKHGPWQLTATGRAFIYGYHTVPKTVIVWTKRAIRFEGPPITITSALDHKEYEDFRQDYLSAQRVLM